MMNTLKWILASGLILLTGFAALIAEQTKSNVVIIFLDDAGYGDFRPHGEPPYPTPNVERLANEGVQFNRFYVPQAVCSASRAALMSGCFPGRTQVFGAHGPNGRGLDPAFANMAELYKADGYATAWFGKWHLGDQEDTRPHVRGFDETAGLMYSNDMWKYHATDPVKWGKVPLAFWENGKITIPEVEKADQKMLTKWATDNATRFIKKNKTKPFFLYVAHSMPHVPLFCSDEFEGKSGVGLYGDVMMEIDWSVGEIMKALKKNGLEDNTVVLFTSDNGPWTGYGNHAGVTPFREAKGTSFAGGVQSACIIKAPGKLKAGSVSDAVFSSVDIMPTFCGLTGTALPANRIDGRDVWDYISGKDGAKPPPRYIAFSNSKVFEGIMTGTGRWRLHIPHNYRYVIKPGNDGAGGKYGQKHIGLSLFDLKNDPMESKNVIEEHPEVAQRLIKIADRHKAKFYPKQKEQKPPRKK